MAVDLKHVRKGDTVKFRCGGQVVVNGIEHNSDRRRILFGKGYSWFARRTMTGMRTRPKTSKW